MFILLFLVFSGLTIINCADVDVGRTIPEFIASRGFDYEIHKIVTKDKYVLTSYRIINPYITRKNLRPVLLQHGVTASAANFIDNSEGFINSSGIYTENGGTIINRCDLFDTNLNYTIGRTLGFVLSACGYDVWLGNSRGTGYSKVNLEIRTKSKRFWEFSFQQMAFYDIPAYLSYILSITNRTTLAYIGHSQGTTQMFALLSARPEYSKMINLFVAMAPVVYFNYANKFIRNVAHKFTDPVRKIPAPFGFSPNELKTKIIDKICAGGDSGNNICVLTQSDNINKTRADVYVSELDITSTWCFVHFGQIANNRDFVYFDYGSPDKNFRHYGTKNAPRFNIGAITSDRIALFYGDADAVADVSDVHLLIQKLNVNLLDNYELPLKGWAHIDFLVSMYTGSLINPRILGLLNQTSNSSV